jgi:uncharacterized protein YcbK (DUF882 family)
MFHFTEDEFKCKCGCQGNNAQESMMDQLDKARGYAGVPFKITSGYRCPRHNKSIGGVDDSAHVRGFAADIAVGDSATCFAVIDGLIKAGFNRIGVYDTFIHADNDHQKPPRVMWRKHG